ncbi:MAG: cytochrome c biogenesis protein ResB [Rhodospirillales bacterium]|nr:cytochrome c biogenesis protein ResB [Rhodospirillales bacterium]
MHNPAQTKDQIDTARFSPLFAVGLWCAGIVIAGAAVQAALPSLPSVLYDRFSVLYALGVALSALAASLARLPAGKVLEQRAGASVLLLLLAFFTAAGTFTVGPDLPSLLDVHRSFYFRGLLGLLAGMQLVAIANRTAWQRSTTGLVMLVAHGGVLLILSGAALDSSFGQRGILKLHQGGQSAVFSETQGLSNALTGGTGRLGATVGLEGIETEYHPRRVHLRLYRDGVLSASYEVRKGLSGMFGDIGFTVTDYMPHAATIRTVTPSLTMTGKAAAMVRIESPDKSASDWLFAEKGNFGFIRDPQGKILVRFFWPEDKPKAIDSPELQIDAQAGRWRLARPGREDTWRMIGESAHAEVEGVKIALSRFMNSVTVTERVENVSDDPKVPVIDVRLERDGKIRDVALSPLAPMPVKLDDRLVLAPTLSEEEPRLFTSRITLDWPDGTRQTRIVQVNHPVRVGLCRLYQSDFDRDDPSFSGFTVNCSPGSWVAESGMVLMVAGLFGAGILLLRARRKAEKR